VRFKLASGEPFAFAGLWESWDSPEGEQLLSFTIVTGEPNELVAPVHNRMPVILDRAALDAWLDPEADDGLIRSMLVPAPPEALRMWPVSTAVNKVDVDGPDLLEPIELAPTLGLA
jgi:putative SOS response-associated peptidase YedK